jgi:hypothetical protein
MENQGNKVEDELTSTQINTILIDEYKLLWTYYIKLLDEKHKTIDYFFKTTALPAGAITAAAGYLSLENASNASEKIAAALIALAVVGIIGLISLIVYAKECANGHIYMESIKSIREGLTKQNKYLEKYVIFNKFEPKEYDTKSFIFGTIRDWRGRFISAVNSAVFSVIIYILLRYYGVKFYNEMLLPIYLTIAYGHKILYDKTYFDYEKIIKAKTLNSEPE